ncbi:MAG: helix-turn-helix transcriptional regulator [Clostridia bacterium]|nr:helix-turn-helix transcriptional regulator [Clostridia bacterium]
MKHTEKSVDAKKSDFEKHELTVRKRTLKQAYDAHWHDYFEIKLILGGNGTVTINGQEHSFKKGSLYLIMPANIHSFESESTVELYNVTLRESIVFDESIIRKLSGFSELFFELNDEEFQNVYYILELLSAENSNDNEYKNQITKNLLECLLLTLIRKSSDSYVSCDTYSTSVQIAISYIKTHFREDITLEKIASLLGFSAGYFSTLFSKSTGKTYIKYLNDLRLDYAKTLLSYDKFSINEVSSMSGFKSYSNFLKAFKAKYGTLPKSHQKGKEQ